MSPFPMALQFTKMHGTGNDYIVIDNRGEKIRDSDLKGLARRLCTRRFSIGADGLLLLYNSGKADVKMRIFNADGSEAEMCGNGIRCFAKYCYEHSIVNRKRLEVETLSGIKNIVLKTEDGKVTTVTVDMGTPIFQREMIPVQGIGKCIDEKLEVEGTTLKITCLSLGNPHCVIFVEDTDGFPVAILGPKIENHKIFPNRTNVEFVQVVTREEIRIRVWERGVGETLACGTGACASVVAANLLERVEPACTVHLLGGDLSVKYSKNKIMLSGEAQNVYKGVISMED